MRRPEPEPAAGTAVAISGLTVILDGLTILEGVDAAIPRAGCTAVVGPNGAGKTTLFLALLGQVPHGGVIGFPAWGSRPRVGYVPQRLDFDADLPLTAHEFVRLARDPLPLWLGTRKTARAGADRLLALVGLERRRDRRIGDLSGGELQRLLLAQALGQRPDLLLLDEATSAADLAGRSELPRLLERLRGEMGFTQVMISHDLPSVLAAADHLICLDRRVLAEGKPADLAASGALDAAFPGLPAAARPGGGKAGHA